MADNDIIIEGSVKLREGKKWKSRWCVMRKPSPVADCVILQVYRDSRSRATGSICNTSISLQQYLGSEIGFTLDKHSNTLALVCRDNVTVIAFDSKERLSQWQLKVSSQLGASRQYLVLVSESSLQTRGPARLHLCEHKVALTSGTPPRLLGVWDLQNLRRFGVVDDRFCFEGGAHCNKGKGLHVLITDHAHEIAQEFAKASIRKLETRWSAFGLDEIDETKKLKSLNAYEPCKYEPDVRFSNQKNCNGKITSFWPSDERLEDQNLGHGDTSSVIEAIGWTNTENHKDYGNVTLPRCVSCISTFGVLSRSSTAVITPNAYPLSSPFYEEAINISEKDFQEKSANIGALEICKDVHYNGQLHPVIPPKTSRLELNLSRKPPMAKSPSPLPRSICGSRSMCFSCKSYGIGAYENYDVPVLPSADVDGEYYDTPKQLKNCLNTKLHKIKKSSSTNAILMKKPCECLSKAGARSHNNIIVVDTEENFQQAKCACQIVTDWAAYWLRLPDCNKNIESCSTLLPDIANVREFDVQKFKVDYDFPFYENLNFALSQQHRNSAKEIQMEAGITSDPYAVKSNRKKSCCSNAEIEKNTNSRDSMVNKIFMTKTYTNKHDEYLHMMPTSYEKETKQKIETPAGYTPMLPISIFKTIRVSARTSSSNLVYDKSASNPTLFAADDKIHTRIIYTNCQKKERYRKRSCSADISRFKDIGKDFDSSFFKSLEIIENSVEAVSKRTLSETEDGGSLQKVALTKNTDSFSSADSGMSSCSLGVKGVKESVWRRACSSERVLHADRTHTEECGVKSSSADAEIPALSAKQFRGVMDGSSSGTSDMSDYIETLSMSSSQSSMETPIAMKVIRQSTSMLRPRSGKEYLLLPPSRINANLN